MLAEVLGVKADLAVCIGDVSDAYSLSNFLHYERMPFGEEWATVTLVMQEIAAAFPEVRIIVGNHDARLEKRLRERLNEDQLEAVAWMTGGTLCPLTALAKRYPNTEISKHETPQGHSVDWLTVVGDAVLLHAEKFSRVPGAALRSVEDWLNDNMLALGLDRYRLVVLGHTHQLSMLPWRGDQMLVECGCLAKQQGYMLDSKIGGRPQKRGYVTFTQHDGITDLNSVKLHWLDMAR
jgi:hypothetical protein